MCIKYLLFLLLFMQEINPHTYVYIAAVYWGMRKFDKEEILRPNGLSDWFKFVVVDSTYGK